MTDTLSGPALAEALARLVGVDVGRVDLTPHGAEFLLSDRTGGIREWLVLGTRYGGREYTIRLEMEGAPVTRAHGYGPTPDAAWADALARETGRHEAVRDVLDHWREGPPGEDGWYEVECDGKARPARVELGRARCPHVPGIVCPWGGLWQDWPTVAGLPARYRALHLSAPPERSEG